MMWKTSQNYIAVQKEKMLNLRSAERFVKYSYLIIPQKILKVKSKAQMF